MSKTFYKDKVVIVTGASSGIGEALVREFDYLGAKVVLASRNADKLNEVAAQLKNEHLVVPTEVANEEDCRKLIHATADRFGKIDILINNAGISMRASFKEVKLDVIKRVMDVNFWGTVYCTKFALPYLLQNKGAVVGISSIAGFVGLPGRTGYSASKFAMNGFLESLRIENHNKGLHVLTACPGFTKSNIRSAGLDKDGNAQKESPREEDKMMTSEEVAVAISEAIVKRKKYLILTRQGLMTVLLNKLFFGKLDKQIFNTMKKEPGAPF